MASLKIYCASCGHANHYTSAKPNFCQKCGEDFRRPSHTGTPRPTSPEIQSKASSLVLETQEEEISSVPQLQGGLQVDTQVYSNEPEKLGDIVGTSEEPPTPRPQPKAPRGRKPSNKKIMEDFKKEAGAIKPNG